MKNRIVPLSLAAALLAVPHLWSQEPKAADAKPPAIQEKVPPPPTKEELEKRFQETLSGATLVGHFTSGGREGATPKEEKYTIDSVTKVPLSADYWLFTSRIQYGNHDVTVPLPLRVLWAGTTPVITLDKVPVPRLGTFSARVMIHDNQYAGMWDGGDHGGLLYGKIVKEKPNDKK